MTVKLRATNVNIDKTFLRFFFIKFDSNTIFKAAMHNPVLQSFIDML
jgi:hypothetical protein